MYVQDHNSSILYVQDSILYGQGSQIVILYVQDHNSAILYVQDSILYGQGSQIVILYVQDNKFAILYVQDNHIFCGFFPMHVVSRSELKNDNLATVKLKWNEIADVSDACVADLCDDW